MKDVADYVNTVDSEDDDPDDWVTYSSKSSNVSQTEERLADEENYADDDEEEIQDVSMPNPLDPSRAVFVKDWIYGLSTTAESSEMRNPFKHADEEDDYEGLLARGWPTLEALADLPCQLVSVEPRLKKMKERKDWPNFDFPPPHRPNLRPRLKKVDVEGQQLATMEFERWRKLSQLGIDVREALVMPEERTLAKDPRFGRWRCEVSPLRRSWTQVSESC
jgi:hypothetical protein